MDNRRHGDSLVRACLHQQVYMVKAGLKYDEADESGNLPRKQKYAPASPSMGDRVSAALEGFTY